MERGNSFNLVIIVSISMADLFTFIVTIDTSRFVLFTLLKMVEEFVNSGNKPTKTKAARPKPVYFWSVLDVQKWLRRHCSDYCNLYSENFLQHEITGRALIRINENTLFRIGIENPVHRREIWREIMKLRLKTDIMEIRDLERQNVIISFD